LKENRLDDAQDYKERLEEEQRKDSKLRKKFKEGKK
jgi:hypothetical protein